MDGFCSRYHDYIYTLCITVYCIQVLDGMIIHHPFTIAERSVQEVMRELSELERKRKALESEAGL